VIRYGPAGAEAEILVLDLLFLVASETMSDKSDLSSEVRSFFLVLCCGTARRLFDKGAVYLEMQICRTLFLFVVTEVSWHSIRNTCFVCSKLFPLYNSGLFSLCLPIRVIM